jgi:hypothetical protein
MPKGGTILRKEIEREETAIQEDALQKPMGQEPLAQESVTQGKVVVSVHLTESQKIALEEMIRDWGLGTAAVGRRLIRYLLGNKATLLELLQKYQAEVADKRGKSRSLTNKPLESRHCKICIRLNPEEKQKLSLLAYEWFYLPGELGRILFELFIMGIIEKNDIWE